MGPGDADATACLNPVPGKVAGEAVMSPACRAFLNWTRTAVLAGNFINNGTTGPVVDGDRRMAYTWAFSVDVKRELANNMAASIDSGGVLPADLQPDESHELRQSARRPQLGEFPDSDRG